MIGIGVIGYGYWGPNMVRNFSNTPGAKMLVVSDLQSNRLDLVRELYPSIETTNDYLQIFANPAIHAVVVATPVSSHFDIALAALQAGKHVLVEKPMTLTSKEGVYLVNEARQRNLILMVDHTFVYMGAVRKIKELVESGDLGEIYYYDSTRVNLGLFQHDVNVLYDLAVHDLSIMDYIMDGVQPVAVSATGKSHVKGKPDNIAYLTLFFKSNFIAHINVNWLSPVKLRQTLIGGDKKMIVFDDLKSNEKVKVYNCGITVSNDQQEIYENMVSYRMGDIWSPKFDSTEALQTEALHFVDCIKNNKHPLTDGEMGLRVVKILEAASESLINKGKTISIMWENDSFC